MFLCRRNISLELIFHKEGMIQDDITHHICYVYRYHCVSYHNTHHKNVVISKVKKQVHHIYRSSINNEAFYFQHMQSCSLDRSMRRKPQVSWQLSWPLSHTAFPLHQNSPVLILMKANLFYFINQEQLSLLLNHPHY